MIVFRRARCHKFGFEDRGINDGFILGCDCDRYS